VAELTHRRESRDERRNDDDDSIRQSPRQLQIDFLFLDLAKCTRCRATDRSLSEALIVVADALKAAGIEVKVTKVHVATEERVFRQLTLPNTSPAL
jgi:Domain of unknown function (DUF2703)